MNLRLTYTHGKGWFVERQETAQSPWTALSAPQPTIELGIGAAGIGQTASVPITSASV